jgi:hypothetical protein
VDNSVELKGVTKKFGDVLMAKEENDDLEYCIPKVRLRDLG